MSRSKISILLAGLWVVSTLFAATISPAQARDPLLIPGKASLYQRVLTRPDTALLRSPEEGAVIETFPAFEIFYAYDRKSIDGKNYVEVGRSLQEGPEGWFDASRTIDWKQAIVLGFNNPANRDRALIYKSKEAMLETLSQEDVAARIGRLREDVESGSLPEDSPIVSVEPAEFVDIENEFYILPILQSETVRLPTNLDAKLLEIASVPAAQSGPANPGMTPEEALRNFRIGVTFVIDTTRSMQPYVDEVRSAISRLRDRIEGSPEGERFRFGLVGFRDNIDLVPELDYVTKVFLPLGEDSSAEKFIQAIDQLDTAQSNSNGYDEDSIAGVTSAIRDMDWTPFGGRYIILITDAGPRQPSEEAAQRFLAPPEVQSELRSEGIALFTLHLRNEAGSFDHEYAEEAYRSMSRFDDNMLYYPISGGDRATFGAQVDALASDFESMVSESITGRLRDAESASSDIGRSASRVGRAMQLAYLGSVQSSQAPDIFKGWLTDRDPIQRNGQPVTPYILMSKDELSTLHDVIEETIRLGNDGLQGDDSSDFFNRLREAVAIVIRQQRDLSSAGTLGDLLGEYLSDLPYRSEIANVTAEDWRDMSTIRERQLIDSLRSKLVAYERIHNDANRWHAIKPGAPAGENVTIVPLSLMP